MIRILLVDDHPVVRQGLRGMLVADDLLVAGDAGSGAEAISLAAALKPDVVLMDLRMPEMDGVAATARIVGTGPRVLVLTTYETTACLNPRHLVLAGGAKSKAPSENASTRELLRRDWTHAGFGSRSQATPVTGACRWGGAITPRWPTASPGSLPMAPSPRGYSSAPVRQSPLLQPGPPVSGAQLH